MARKRTYIRAWREKKGLTLDQVVARLDEIGVKMTGASLSRIERGLQPYNQDLLEPIAESLGVTVAQLLEHDPKIEKSEVIDFVNRLSDREARQAQSVLRAMFGERA